MLHIAIGAFAGAIIGAGAAALAQRARGQRLSWKTIAAGAAGGLVAGTITAATLGAAGAATAGAFAKAGGLALAGGSGGFTEQVTDNVLHDRTWHEEVAETTVVAAAVGVATFGLAKGVGGLARRAGPAWRQLGKRATRHGLASLPGRARAWAGEAAHLPRNLWQGYLGALKSRPLLTKSLTSGALMGGGDLIAQKIEGRESIDWKRTGFMTAYGLVVYGPSTHAWYGLLDRLIPKHTLLPVLAKVGLNSAIWTPYYLGTFTFASGIFNGDRSVATMKARFERDFVKTWKADFVVWPAADGIIFRWVPPTLQPAAVSVVSLGWNAYLSLVGNGHGGEAHDDATQKTHDVPDGEPAPPPEAVGLIKALDPLAR